MSNILRHICTNSLQNEIKRPKKALIMCHDDMVKACNKEFMWSYLISMLFFAVLFFFSFMYIYMFSPIFWVESVCFLWVEDFERPRWCSKDPTLMTCWQRKRNKEDKENGKKINCFVVKGLNAIIQINAL